MLIVFVIIGGCGFALYRWYDTHHISSDLRRTLTAACDTSATSTDIQTYIRDARLQVHTKKDAVLLSHFQEVLSLSDQITSLQHDAADYGEPISSHLGPGSSFDQLLNVKRAYVQRGQKVPTEVDRLANQIIDDEKNRFQTRLGEIAEDNRQIQIDTKKARAILDEIKQQLGLSSNRTD